MARFGLHTSILLTGLLVSACSGGRMQQVSTAPAPLPAAPSRPVQISQLPPIDAAPQSTDLVAPASVGRSSDTIALDSLTGGWQLAGGGSSCSMSLTKTGWTGGYRASTRGCTTPELQGVNAWSFDDGQVVLKDGGGAPIARLAARSESSMAGATNGGAGVTATR